MPRPKNQKRQVSPKRESAALPAGVKLAPAPKSAARRKLLSGADIETSGGLRTIHAHAVGR
jgi:hypothetical protein